jgi:uncharacterized protein (TIGR02391 family)
MAPQHPLIEAGARPQFLIGNREQAVVASLRAAQVRVRGLAGPGNDAIGAGLMTRAFGPGGRLTGPPAVKAEQEGTRALFAAASAVPRNPPGHRQVDDDDASAAAEAVQAASLLMRLLDRVEDHLRGGRLSARPACRLSMVSGGPYTAQSTTRKVQGHARVKVPRQISHPSLTPPGPGRAGPAPSLSPWI